MTACNPMHTCNALSSDVTGFTVTSDHVFHLMHEMGMLDRNDRTDKVCEYPHGGMLQFTMNRIFARGHAQSFFWHNKPVLFREGAVDVGICLPDFGNIATDFETCADCCPEDDEDCDVCTDGTECDGMADFMQKFSGGVEPLDLSETNPKRYSGSIFNTPETQTLEDGATLVPWVGSGCHGSTFMSLFGNPRMGLGSFSGKGFPLFLQFFAEWMELLVGCRTAARCANSLSTEDFRKGYEIWSWDFLLYKFTSVNAQWSKWQTAGTKSTTKPYYTSLGTWAWNAPFTLGGSVGKPENNMPVDFTAVCMEECFSGDVDASEGNPEFQCEDDSCGGEDEPECTELDWKCDEQLSNAEMSSRPWEEEVCPAQGCRA
jgi:hypothetical protein